MTDSKQRPRKIRRRQTITGMSQSAFAGSAMMSAPGNGPESATTPADTRSERLQTQLTIEVDGYTGRAVLVEKGSTIRVTNLRGTQVADMFALLKSDPDEVLDTARTRLVTQRLFPHLGQQFVSNRYRPLLTFTADTSKGVHDTMYATCDQGLHDLLGAGADHANCHDNFLAAIKEVGLNSRTVPAPVNLFQNTPVTSSGKLKVLRSEAKPGDYVEFRAEETLYFVLTACSVDIGSDINGGESTPLQIDITPALAGV